MSDGQLVRYRDGDRTITTIVDSRAVRERLEWLEQASERTTTRRVASSARTTRYVRVDAGDTAAALSLIADPGRLNELARATSMDWATLAFREAVAMQPENRWFADLRDSLIAKAERAPLLRSFAPCYRLLIVPGWRHRTSPDNGSDLALVKEIAARYGFEFSAVPTDENGTIEDNAALVGAHLRASQSAWRDTIIISASKGGPEVANALQQLVRSDGPSSVAGWINVSGLIGGSPLADRAMRWPASFVIAALLASQGATMNAVPSMTTQVRRADSAQWIAIPEVFIVNYLGAPFSGEVTPRGAFGHWSLGDWGPNDGVALLPDLLVPGAVSLIESGADHFLSDPALVERFEALFAATLIARSNATANELRSRCGHRVVTRF